MDFEKLCFLEFIKHGKCENLTEKLAVFLIVTEVTDGNTE